ncbi:MAG: hypothetical protein A2Y40_02215 [Candidatus Margulisbacteria bacterium GWF2_35_9]|nr:MAG: hypothetical protein A2Y40_02215 [Candidatus Margulisbacteria bacterium GWF2_35_9]
MFKLKKELILFLVGVAFISIGEGIFNSVLNNYLNEAHHITSLNRTILELPRELPGLLVVFVSTLLFFLPSRRLAAFASLFSFSGLIYMALFPESFSLFLVWIFIFSTGQHLLIPLASSVGMELASKGQDGKRLGQVNSVRNMAVIIGSLIIYIGFRFFHFNFTISFLIAGVFYLLAALYFFKMNPGAQHPAKQRLKIYKEYKMFYWLSILFGTRKQIFLTFAPWVLVTIYHKPTSVIATLLTFGGVAGIVFQPYLGRMIDRFGEKIVLALEAGIMIIVCLLYGFSHQLFTEHTSFLIIATCYIIDQLLMSVSMARSIYLKKIALHPDHISPTLTMGVTMDHFFSISIALLGGLVWYKFGFQYVFLAGSAIAIINLISALNIKYNSITTS